MEPVLGRVRAAGWERLSYGLHVPAAARSEVSDLQALQRVLPADAAFTHLTATRLRGWWQPSSIRHPIFVTMQQAVPRPRRREILASRHPRDLVVTECDGVRVTAPAESLLEAARDLGVLDLVVLGDCALRLGHVTVWELKRAAARRRRGAPLLRRVIPLLDPRSESAWESIMRVLHLAAEIPVTPQYKIYDDRGRFVARADLRINRTRRLQEYDGAGHRDGEVHRIDLARDRALVRTGWERAGYTKQDLLEGAAAIIADADRILNRPSDPARRDAWNRLVLESLHGPIGRARALRRWYGPPTS